MILYEKHIVETNSYKCTSVQVCTYAELNHVYPPTRWSHRSSDLSIQTDANTALTSLKCCKSERKRFSASAWLSCAERSILPWQQALCTQQEDCRRRALRGREVINFFFNSLAIPYKRLESIGMFLLMLILKHIKHDREGLFDLIKTWLIHPRPPRRGVPADSDSPMC